MVLFSINLLWMVFFSAYAGASCEHLLTLNQLVDKYSAQPHQVSEGSGWSHLFKGVYRGKSVFIKVMNPKTRTASDYDNEAHIFKQLKGTSYGDSLIAIEPLDQKRRALILKFYPLVVTLPTSQLNEYQVLFLRKNAEQILAQVDFILDDLRRRSIVPLDFQIGVTKAGKVVVIDVEAYQKVEGEDVYLYHFSKQKIVNFLSPYRSILPLSRYDNFGQLGSVNDDAWKN